MDLTFTIGLGLTILGTILAAVAVMLIAVSGRGGGTRSGGILLIGPIPIVFGTDRQSVRVIVILAIVLILIMSALTVFPYLVK